MRHLLSSLAAASLITACAAGTAPASAPPSPPGGPQAPGRACTEMGCVSGFHIGLEPSSRWPAGRYKIEITADGATQQCEITLPLQACDAGPSMRCTGAALTSIGESGCALPPAEHGLSSIDFSGSPARVNVRIARDGAPIVAQDFTPTYRRVQPNGPGCEPICNQASASIAITF